MVENNKERVPVFALAGIILGLLILAGGVSAATNVSSCQTINQSGVYALNTSLNNIASTCIRINASNVAFDGAGYTIDGNDVGSDYGVYVYNSTTALTNVTVKNLIVTDWHYGVYYRNAQNGSIENNTVNSNTMNGIALETSSNYNTLSNNIANSNTQYGIYLYSSSNYNTLSNNTANSNTQYGIYLYSSSNYNILTNNTVNSNIWDGIYIRSSKYNNITDNTVNSNRHGIYLYSSSNSNILTNNTVNSNTMNGIYISSFSYYNNISDNTVSLNNDTGIYLYNYPRYNTVSNNTVSSNNNTGIGLFSQAYYNTFFNNTVSLNNNTGIDLMSSSRYNTFSDNTVSLNNDTGIILNSADYNTFSDNTVSSNNNTGISVNSGSDYNTFSNNTVSSHTIYGIHLASSSNYNTITNSTIDSNGYGINAIGGINMIFHNNFLSNTIANANATGNSAWDKGLWLGGNYWSNWTSPDSDGDGIVDNPYVIPGGQNQDRAPFATQSGWTSFTPSAILIVGTIDPGATFYVNGTLASPGQTYNYSPGDSITLTTTYNGTNYTDEIEIWYQINVSVHANSTTANGPMFWYLDTDMGYTPYDIFIFETNGTSWYYIDMFTNPAGEAAKIIGLHTKAPNGKVRIERMGSHSHGGAPAKLAAVFYGTVENDNKLYIRSHCGTYGSSFNKIIGKYVEFEYWCKNDVDIMVQEIIADTISIDDTEVTIWAMNLTKQLYTSDKFHGKSWNEELPGKASLDEDPMLWFKARNPNKWNLWPYITVQNADTGTGRGGESWSFKDHKKGDKNFWEMDLNGTFYWKMWEHSDNHYGHFLGPLTKATTFEFRYKGLTINFFADNETNYNHDGNNFDGRGSDTLGGTDFWNPLLTTNSPNGYGYTSGSIYSPTQVLKIESGLIYAERKDSGYGEFVDFYLTDNQDLLILSDTSNIDFDCTRGCSFYEGTNSHWVVENNLTYLGDTPNDNAISITKNEISRSGNDVRVTANNSYGDNTKSQMYVAYRKKTDYGRQFTRTNLTYKNAQWVTSISLANIGPNIYDFYIVAVQKDNVYGKVVEIDPAVPETPRDSSGPNSPKKGPGASAEVLLVANSIDQGLASEFLAYLQANGITASIVSATEFTESEKNDNRLIIILGGPDAPEGIGAITREVLTDSEEAEIREAGSMKMIVKYNPYTYRYSYNQIVVIIAGSDRTSTQGAEAQYNDDVKNKVLE